MSVLKLKRSEDIVWETLEEQTLAVRAVSGESWTLNESASRVWKLCDGTRELCDIIRAYSNASADGMRHARAEVFGIYQRMIELGLLQGAPAVAGGISHVARMSSELDSIKPLGLIAGSRRRPTPRGNSGPG